MSNAEEPKTHIQQEIMTRLKKIEGQVRGIQGMVEGGKECEDVLNQVRAAQSALRSVSKLVLKNYLYKCYGRIGDSGSPENALLSLEKSVEVLIKFIEG